MYLVIGIRDKMILYNVYSMPSYLPICPPVKYSGNKNITNYSTNNPASLGTKVSIYSKLIQASVGKKGGSTMYFGNLSLDAFGKVQGTSGGSSSPIKNTFG